MDNLDKTYEIIKNLKLIRETLKKTMEKPFKNFDLTGPQSMLIGILGHHGKLKISDLSKKMGLSNSTVSGIIDRLETHGLIERIRDSIDRRVIMVDLKDDFRKIAKDKFCSFDNHFSESIKNASQEELDIILNGLTTLKTVLERKNDNV